MTKLSRLRPTQSGRRSGGDRRAAERRVLYVGLAISLALHVVFIALAGRWLEPAVGYDRVAPEVTVPEPDRTMRAVALAEPTDPTEPAEPDPALEIQEQVAPRPTAPRPPSAQAEEPAQEAELERRTAAERLAPRVVDPRLWRPLVLLPREPTFEEVQDRVAAAMEMLSDSALADAERAIRSRDWTVEDARGGRWGISPGKIHLGSITLPLPLYFPVDMEAELANAYWYELEAQLERTEFLESFDARVKAIRERRERERGERRSGTSGGGS
jgi:hypothetical protein